MVGIRVSMVWVRGNNVDKLRHTRSVAYSVELVLLNKHQISGGGAYVHRYRVWNSVSIKSLG